MLIDFGRLDPNPDPHGECGSRSRRAKMTCKNRKKLMKVKEIHV
jgi:hypothetical protein